MKNIHNLFYVLFQMRQITLHDIRSYRSTKQCGHINKEIGKMLKVEILMKAVTQISGKAAKPQKVKGWLRQTVGMQWQCKQKETGGL